MTKGTKEWAKSNINIQQGCPHGCLYCYAFFMNHRFWNEEELTFEEEYSLWTNRIRVYKEKVEKQYRKRDGVIMFPTSHDITEGNIVDYLIVLRKLIRSKNQVLITTKAHLPIIQRICNQFQTPAERELITFRFTITSMNNEKLKLWERHAPLFEERFEALKFAFQNGFKTSISCEPYLTEPTDLMKMTEPFINDTFWVGLMNKAVLLPSVQQIYIKDGMDGLYGLKKIETMIPTWRSILGTRLRLKDSIENLLRQ